VRCYVIGASKVGQIGEMQNRQARGWVVGRDSRGGIREGRDLECSRADTFVVSCRAKSTGVSVVDGGPFRRNLHFQCDRRRKTTIYLYRFQGAF
jgi:hypothetical protein